CQFQVWPVGCEITGTTLGFQIAHGDTVSRMTGTDGSYTTYTYSNGAWSPSQPTIRLGEAFRSNKAKAVVWRQNYSAWRSGERSRRGCTGRRPRRPDRVSQHAAQGPPAVRAPPCRAW